MPFLSNKNKLASNELKLNIHGELCHDQIKIVNRLCNYFANMADGIGEIDNITDTTFETHQSI